MIAGALAGEVLERGPLGGESYVALAEGLQNALWALVMTASTCSSAPPR